MEAGEPGEHGDPTGRPGRILITPGVAPGRVSAGGLQGPFLWGAATSAYQVEGGHERADWHTHFPAGAACAHERLYPGDLDALASLGGLNAYRFSVEWSAVEPEPGRFSERALSHYAAMVGACRTRGLHPVVTLWHFTLPRWFAQRGGWMHPDAVDAFVRYATAVAEALPKPAAWVSLNEPTIHTAMGYLRGNWPPFRRSPAAAARVVMRLRRAHRAVLPVLRATGAPVGIAHHYAIFEPVSRWSAAAAMDLLGNRSLLREPADFLGLNYYTRFRVAGFRMLPAAAPAEATDMGWEVYPQGLERLLRFLGRRGLPVVVTENGIATEDDERRSAFIAAHVEAVRRARRDGVDVRGYFYWSLLDNFEWAEGFRPRFGLLGVDYATQRRTVRPSAKLYGALAAEASAGWARLTGPPSGWPRQP